MDFAISPEQLAAMFILMRNGHDSELHGRCRNVLLDGGKIVVQSESLNGLPEVHTVISTVEEFDELDAYVASCRSEPCRSAEPVAFPQSVWPSDRVSGHHGTVG